MAGAPLGLEVGAEWVLGGRCEAAFDGCLVGPEVSRGAFSAASSSLLGI